MTNRLPEWTNRYISIPYDTLDCWGLVERVYAAEYGILIGPREEQKQALREKDWKDVLMGGMGYLEGDVILFRDMPLKKHVGLLLSPELMLHSNKGCNSCIERWESPRWHERVISIYRHVDRCNKHDS